MAISGLLVAGILMAISAVASSAIESGVNSHNVNATNELNKELANAANEQNQYNMEHAHQIEMNDLKAAGLNPVLTATGGNGANLTHIEAPTMQAPKVDLSGVSTAISGMMNMMMMSTMMQEKNALIAQQNDILQQRADTYSTKADVQTQILRKKLARMATNGASKSVVSSAKQMADYYDKAADDKLFRELIRDLS